MPARNQRRFHLERQGRVGHGFKKYKWQDVKMSVVDEIKTRMDIVDLISEYVTLRKSGRNYTGLCPFHSEKTPSFVVFPETQTWHCFGACATGGDIFTFIQKRENMDFPESLRLLAQRAGVALEPPSEKKTAEEQLKQRLREINAAAAKYFHDLLLTASQGEIAREYLTQRGINQETTSRFQLGYALDSWQALSDHLRTRGYQQEDILSAGLIIERGEDGSGTYDRFRGRLVIPIRDSRGRVIGFGARTLDPEGVPKYMNSPQTPLFDKSGVLFGLDMAKGAIRAQGLAVIAEGYMDVLQAHQAGIGNVVASMGTALTEAQLRLLKRMTRNFALALDADAAGDQATLRGLAVARETLDREIVPVPTPRGLIRYESRLNANISIITLPPGQDPDDVIRESPERWAQLVGQALPVVDYYFQIVTGDLDMSTAKGKAEARHRLMEIIREIGDHVEQTHYVQKLARLIRVSEDILWRDLAGRRPRGKTKLRQGERPEPEKEGKPTAPSHLSFGIEEHCLSVLLHRPYLMPDLTQALANVGENPPHRDEFADVENRAIFDALMAKAEADAIDIKTLREELDATLHPRFDALIKKSTKDPLPDDDEAVPDLVTSVLRIRQRRLQALIQELRFLSEDAMARGDIKAEAYGETMRTYTSALRRIHQALASRSTLQQQKSAA
ncbi:MAG: DNA primase [Chloroflexota bacterium]|nr:DNA primase [Chloroflexota bacterium]